MGFLESILNDTSTYSSRYYTFMATYRLPMTLGSNYYNHILNLGDPSQVGVEIQLLSEKAITLLHEPHIIKTIYDESINNLKLYPPFQANSLNKNISYNQIDLFYVISASIVSLKNLPIDRHSSDFVIFNSYITPSYDNLINGTKNNFHRKLQTLIGSITNK